MANDFDLDRYIRKIPDFPKKGTLFYDITSILINPEAFQYCIDSMVEIYSGQGIEAVAAIEARGFVFAAPFAYRLGIPLILIRKKGKLPGATISRSYDLEYGQAEIEIQPNDVPKGKKLLLLDDLIATGGTFKAACNLLIASGGTVTDLFGIVGLPFLKYDSVLQGLSVRTLINYESE